MVEIDVKSEEDNPQPLLRCYPLESLKKRELTPILYIGSGMSKRYLKDSPSWEEMLIRVAGRIGLDLDQFISLKAEVQQKENGNDIIYPDIATRLSELLFVKIQKGLLKPEVIFGDEELRLYRNGIHPLKILVSSTFKDTEMTQNQKLINEFNLLKQLTEVVPVVVTTNYDQFLETQVFENKFKTYTRPEQYYFSQSEDIGEIFKIHGCISDPDSMILTRQDYDMMEIKSRMVISRIVSLMCNHPIVFLGYSMDDQTLHEMLKEITRGMGSDDIRNAYKNLIHISYSPGDIELNHDKETVSSKDGTVSIYSITTDNFQAVFHHLLSLKRINPVETREIKKTIDKIIFGKVGKGVRIMCNLEETDEKDLLLIVTDDRQMDAVGPYITIEDVIDDVINDNGKLDPKDIVTNWFEKTRINVNSHVPLFYYLEKLGDKEIKISDRLNKFIKLKNEQFDMIFKSLDDSTSSSREDIEKSIGNKNPDSLCNLIIISYKKDYITRDEARSLLKSIKEKQGNVKYLERSLVYLDYKNFKGSQRSISHTNVG